MSAQQHEPMEREAPSDPTPRADAPASASTVERFERSMVMDFDKWHDGIGYDVELIRAADPDAHAAIEALLLARPVADWRDVEALAVLDTPKAREALRRAAESGDARLALAVADYAPELQSRSERVASLVSALERAEIYGGLTQALLQVESFHPPEVVDALLRGTLDRDGEVAVHFAAMLMFVQGVAGSSFDWEQRPFFLRFNTGDRAERLAAYRELCAKIGRPAER